MAHLCEDLRHWYKVMRGETDATQNEYMSLFLVTTILLLNELAKLCLQLYVERKYG